MGVFGPPYSIMASGKIKSVLKTTSGSYIGDTKEFRRVYPDAVPMQIQMPTFDESKNGVPIQELPNEEETHDGHHESERHAGNGSDKSGFGTDGDDLIQRYQFGAELNTPTTIGTDDLSAGVSDGDQLDETPHAIPA